MKILRYLIPVTLSLLITTNASSKDLNLDIGKKVSDKITAFKQGKINAYASQLSEGISSFAEEYFDNMKYLDLDINTQNYLKPTFSVMSVNEIMKIDSGTFFNQTSINTHDGDETINLGFGIRKLLNDNTLLLGANTFYDHQFTENHERVGVGAEAITSLFDVRGNYYNALSARRTNAEGTFERAMDGWDLRGDYHLPIKEDVSLFFTKFQFKNPEETSSYKERGDKIGLDAQLGNFEIEAGYMNDNQDNDAWFGNIKYVIIFGAENQSNTPKDFKTFTDVSDKLYQPVKRENKIRVVKIDASGVVVGGF